MQVRLDEQRACAAESMCVRKRVRQKARRQRGVCGRERVAPSGRVTRAASSPPSASASVMHLHSWAVTLHEASNVQDDASRSFGVALVAGV